MEGRNSPGTKKKEVVDVEQQVVVQLQALVGCHLSHPEISNFRM
jgi:predicted RNA-binding protein with EMAP domain